MSQKYAGGPSLEAIKDWAAANFMPLSAVSGGVILRLTFGSEFLGQSYTLVNQDDQTEAYSGIVDATLTTDITVQCTSATYVITIDTIPAVGGQTVTRYLKTYKYFGIYPRLVKYIDIVTWGAGTAEQIAAMLAAADAGWLDLQTEAGWKVGDVRTVALSAMAATGVGESNPAQNVQLVLSHAGATAGISRADGGEIHFQVDQVHGLQNRGYMNSSNTNAGSWEGSHRRAWCNDVYRNAVPSDLRDIFKLMKVSTAQSYNGSSIKETEDYFALRAEKEIFGSRTYSNTNEANALAQVDWYKTASHRIKQSGGSASHWWERSPHSGSASRFCYVSSYGGASGNGASNAYGLAPFGCI